MKLDELVEMTTKANDLSYGLKRSFDYFSEHIDELTHIGDIDSIKILRFEKVKSSKPVESFIPDIIDFLIDEFDTKIGMMTGSFVPINSQSKLWSDGIKKILEVKEWIIFKQRAGIGENYLFFLKNVMKTPLLISNVHSVATQEFLKKQSVHFRFKLSWYNEKTGDIVDFKDDKYSKTGLPNEWRTLIESDEYEIFNQFRTPVGGFRDSYEWLFDPIGM